MDLTGFINVSNTLPTVGNNDIHIALPQIKENGIQSSTPVNKAKPKTPVQAKNGFWRSVAALLGAGMINTVVNTSIAMFAGKEIILLDKGNIEAERQTLSEVADYAISKSKACSKGAKIMRVDPNNQESFKEAARLMKSVMDKSLLRFLPEEAKYLFNCAFSYASIEAVNNGIGSMPLFSKNTIVSPKGKFEYSTLNSLGKLINQNTVVGKILKYSGIATAFALPAVIILSLCTKNKQEENDKKLSGWSKFTNGVRQNAGKLAALCILPSCVSSIWGDLTASKYAKQYIKNSNNSQILAKISKIKNLNIALGTSSMVVTGFATYLGVKIKDGLKNSKSKKLQKLISGNS